MQFGFTTGLQCDIIPSMKRYSGLAIIPVVIAAFFIITSLDRSTGGHLKLGSSSFMEDVSIVYKDNGAVKWQLHAGRADFVGKSDIDLKNITISLPERGLTLTSGGGTYNMETRDFSIAGDINAISKDYEIRASSLRWDASRNNLVSDKRVSISGRHFTIEGQGLTASPETAKLKENVRAVFHAK